MLDIEASESFGCAGALPWRTSARQVALRALVTSEIASD
jgi:hypothetical protein